MANDLLSMTRDGSRHQLARAQHIAARRRAEQIAPHVDHLAVLSALGLESTSLTPERWQSVLSCAVRARSREQVAHAVSVSIRE